MRRRQANQSVGDFFNEESFVSYYSIVKKTIQEYVEEIDRYARYKTVIGMCGDGTIMDDRSRLIDLYDSCYIQDAHLQAVIETLNSNMIGERYMLAEYKKGKWVRNDKETDKIQGTQFEKIVQGILEKEMYGYSCVEILQDVEPSTGRLKEVNILERRNILPNQWRVIQRQHQWSPGWDLHSEQYKNNYVLFNDGKLGLFSATTPLILAKKFTIANWVNFAHTYGQPIIHGKTSAEDQAARRRLAAEIANAAQKKVLVTDKDSEIDIKTFTMSNSEKIYDGLKNFTNSEVSNLILGSESMAGATQSYVGSTKAHEDIFRARIRKYRRITENEMNEKVIPILKYWGIISPNVYFKYSKQVEMANEEKIKLYDMLTNKYEVDPDIIENDLGVIVGQQFNSQTGANGSISTNGNGNDNYVMSDEEYYKRYGHERNAKSRVNFL